MCFHWILSEDHQRLAMRVGPSTLRWPSLVWTPRNKAAKVWDIVRRFFFLWFWWGKKSGEPQVLDVLDVLGGQKKHLIPSGKTSIAMENDAVLWENSLFLRPCSSSRSVRHDRRVDQPHPSRLSIQIIHVQTMMMTHQLPSQVRELFMSWHVMTRGYPWAMGFCSCSMTQRSLSSGGNMHAAAPESALTSEHKNLRGRAECHGNNHENSGNHQRI